VARKIDTSSPAGQAEQRVIDLEEKLKMARLVRNSILLDESKQGRSMYALAREVGLSTSRVWQLIMRARARERG